jgi:hypothetical protein
MFHTSRERGRRKKIADSDDLQSIPRPQMNVRPFTISGDREWGRCNSGCLIAKTYCSVVILCHFKYVQISISTSSEFLVE